MVARQAAHHYFSTTTPQQQAGMHAIDNQVVSNLPHPNWCSDNFPWCLDHFSTSTATTQLSKLVELYWHVRSFVAQGMAQNIAHQHKQQPTLTTIWTQLQQLSAQLDDLHNTVGVWRLQQLSAQRATREIQHDIWGILRYYGLSLER